MGHTWKTITKITGLTFGFLCVVCTLLFIVFLCEIRGGGLSNSRTGTAIARILSFSPYFEYGYTKHVCEEECKLADNLKTWDDSFTVIPWDDVAASIYRRERPNKEFGCVYKDRNNCPGCHEQQVRIYYKQQSNNQYEGQEGWLVVCLNCRKQVKFEPTK